MTRVGVQPEIVLRTSALSLNRRLYLAEVADLANTSHQDAHTRIDAVVVATAAFRPSVQLRRCSQRADSRQVANRSDTQETD